jgi:hypothetical protein
MQGMKGVLGQEGQEWKAGWDQGYIMNSSKTPGGPNNPLNDQDGLTSDV